MKLFGGDVHGSRRKWLDYGGDFNFFMLNYPGFLPVVDRFFGKSIWF